MADPIFVIGATGRAGAPLCRHLARAGRPFVPVVRDAVKWRELRLAGERRVIELSDPRWIGDSLADARIVVSCAHARYTATLLAAAAQDAAFVMLGSYRRYAPAPDGDGLGVQAGEAAFLASGRRGVMLHPALIYGGEETRRLAAWLAGRRVVMLPGGGRVKVQPIHEDDVARSIVAAADHGWAGPRAFPLPGPERVAYADFLRHVARAAGLRAPVVMSKLPGLGSMAGIGLDAMPVQDQGFPGEAAAVLGTPPRPLEVGLAETFAT